MPVGFLLQAGPASALAAVTVFNARSVLLATGGSDDDRAARGSGSLGFASDASPAPAGTASSEALSAFGLSSIFSCCSFSLLITSGIILVSPLSSGGVLFLTVSLCVSPRLGVRVRLDERRRRLRERFCDLLRACFRRDPDLLRARLERERLRDFSLVSLGGARQLNRMSKGASTSVGSV